MDIGNSHAQVAIGGGTLATAGLATTGIALAKGLHMVESAPPPQVTSTVTKIDGVIVSAASSSVSEVSRSLHLRSGAMPFVVGGAAAALLGVTALLVGLQK